jgi:diguanylate cyclase (GGDEF)-like protein
MLMESDIMQFFLDNRYFISTLKYLSLITLPIPIIFYLSLIANYRYKKQLLLLNSFFILNAAVMLTLQFADVINFHDGLFVLHALMIIIFTIVLIQLCIDIIVHKNKNLSYITLSFGILFIFSVLEILSYYIGKDTNSGSYLQLGVLFFLIVLSANSFRKAIEIVRLSENAKQYEYLATRDYMTKCKNRNSYIKELDQIIHDQKITILLADINNTKFINDTYGHHAGDFIIVQCSQCLMDIFGNNDYCFRIGGDEFVCIEYSQNEEVIQDKIKTFFKRCEEVNAYCPYPFEVSIGYAFFDKTQDHSIYDTVKRADKDMYHRKNKMKFNSIP